MNKLQDDQPEGMTGCHYCWIEGDSCDGVPHLNLWQADGEDSIVVPVYELVQWLIREGAPVAWLDHEKSGSQEEGE